VTEDIVNGHEVIAASDKGIDYAKLMDKFGC
jgi:tryptophanyl-tRNA synthetase